MVPSQEIDGRGLTAKLYWDAVSRETSILASVTLRVFIASSTAGLKGPDGNRYKLCTQTPAHAPKAFAYGNMGGNVRKPKLENGIYAIIKSRKLYSVGLRILGK